MGFNKCRITCIYYYTIIQNCFTALKHAIYTACLSFLPSCQTPGNHWSVYCLHSSSFPEYHRILSIWYVAFSNWLISLSNYAFKFSPCLHDLIAHFFLSLNNTSLNGCSTVYLPIKGHLPILTIISKAAINIHMQIFVWAKVNSFGKVPRN